MGVAMIAAAYAAGGIRVDIVPRFGVGRKYAFIIAQNNLPGILGNQILGHHRNLAAAAGGVHNKSGHCHTRGMSAQILDNLNTRADGRTEMSNPLRHIALIDIIRFDPDFQQ